MKTVKTKLHQHRKARKPLHPALAIGPEAIEATELEIQLYRLERSPKQENL